MVEKAAIEKTTIWKVSLRIIPFFMLGYFFSMLDRTNIGVGPLQMNMDVWLSVAAYGLGGSLLVAAAVGSVRRDTGGMVLELMPLMALCTAGGIVALLIDRRPRPNPDAQLAEDAISIGTA